MFAKINEVLNKNALVMYNLAGDPIKFDYQRHICSNIKDLPGSNRKEKIFNSVILAISLWKNWEIHARKSMYPYNWYGCVQIENEWITDALDTPPYVIFNSENPDKIKNFESFKTIDIVDFPINLSQINFFNMNSIGIKKAFFEEDGSSVWRLTEKS